ncbi:sensor histidine kinase [Acetanaerobacterium elongatum]|uniref:histidine kinase n=1 Tax=Acetanaerobacterium elongatum TaxID=258515 RepID=A0A1H0C2L1_9FIRM|nr:sensor histidine kinase [Acetanaerobacterium elongatum]SDN52103.1 Histidine kinase-, DNA gyrase B-, and HSP90-like ATPase [Acetanaerobacterium elongatum]
MNDRALLDNAIAFFENLELPTVILNEEFELIWLSDYAAKIYPQFTLKNGFSSVFMPERAAAVKAILLQNKRYAFTSELLPTTNITCTLTPIMKHGEFLFVIASLSQAPKVSPYDNEDVSMAIASFSKNIREPLFYTFSALATISHRFESNEDYTSLSYVNAVYRNCYAILRTVTHLSDYLKDINGLQSFNPRAMVFPSFVRDLYTAAESATRGVGIPLYLNVEDAPHFVVSFDEDRLSMAILNILLNSFLYTKEGNEITMTLKRVGNSAVLVISDKGVGIAQENLSKVFNSLYSADFGNEPLHRIGLGLTLARSIVMQHGGTITIESEEHVGTNVTIRLPVVEDAETPDCFCTAPTGYLKNRFSPIFVELAELSSSLTV